MKVTAMVLSAALLATGCGDDGGGGDSDASAAVPDGSAAVPDAAQCSTAPTTFFVNRLGETFSSGINDPVANTSTIISGTYTMTAPTLTQTEWDGLIACARGLVAAYNVELTETDPSPAAHHELIVTSLGSEDIGLSAGITGTSVWSCGEFTNVAYTFNAVTGMPNYRAQCEDMVMNILRTANVETLYHCPTLPSFLMGCGDKSIVDIDAECGEFQARSCQCGGTTQNPHQAMLAKFGPACTN